MKKSHREWTNREHATLLRMRSEGFRVREIAEELGRSFDSVASRLQQRNVYQRVKIKPANKPRICEFITIEKSAIPDWYERGWRFVAFDGDKFVFERGAQ